MPRGLTSFQTTRGDRRPRGLRDGTGIPACGATSFRSHTHPRVRYGAVQVAPISPGLGSANHFIGLAGASSGERCGYCGQLNDRASGFWCRQSGDTCLCDLVVNDDSFVFSHALNPLEGDTTLSASRHSFCLTDSGLVTGLSCTPRALQRRVCNFAKRFQSTVPPDVFLNSGVLANALQAAASLRKGTAHEC